MKKILLIIPVIVIAAIGGGVLMLRNAQSLHSAARRNWEQKSLREISARVGNLGWVADELSRLKVVATNDASASEGWLSDHMIVMKNGEWLAYANICQKENWRIRDLFLAKGSDGRWYYSTYHFCISMIVLRGDDQPESLAGFTKAYFLRVFDGHSDDCLQQTWPTELEHDTANQSIEPTASAPFAPPAH